MTTPSELYPFSTFDGKVIPLDIIKPKALLYRNLTTSFQSLALASNTGVAFVYADTDCFLVQGAGEELAENTVYDTMLFIPKKHVVITTLEEDASYSVRAREGTGMVFIQIIEKWAGLSLDRAYTRR